MTDGDQMVVNCHLCGISVQFFEQEPRGPTQPGAGSVKNCTDLSGSRGSDQVSPDGNIGGVNTPGCVAVSSSVTHRYRTQTEGAGVPGFTFTRENVSV